MWKYVSQGCLRFMRPTHITTAIIFSALIFATLVSCVPASAVSVSSTSLPEGFGFGENYYTVYGNPNISASLVGDNLFDRGDEVTLNINLMNKGVITSFRSENDFALNDADTDLNKKLEQTEMQYEACLLYTSDAADEEDSVDLG